MVHARVQGGVYFVHKTYGVSLEAVKVLVMLDEAAPTSAGGAAGFDFGDCVMVEADADDADSLP